MPPSTTGNQNAADGQGGNPQYRPLNAFMAFRSFYNKMLPNMQQKDRSGVLTTLWNDDPFKNQWTMMAKVYTYLRDELGKDAVPLTSFLEHACSVLGIPPLDAYLQQQGFALLENDTGHLSLIKYTNALVLSPGSLDTISGENSEDGRKKRNRAKNAAILTQSSSFQKFKERNKESIAAAASAFTERNEKSDIKSATALFGDEEAAASLYAEHELLQAVFDRGLEIDPNHIGKDDNPDGQKHWLVQKLYSMAYEMLIGGEFPVICGTRGFSQTIKHNPIAAAAQLFSRAKAFDFDVLVVDKDDRVKNHVFCEVKPEGGDKAVVLPTSGQRTAEAQAVAGPFYASSQNKTDDVSIDANGKGDASTSNTTPTYTQQMSYQSAQNGGKFHVFSSQPSALGNSIIASNSLNGLGNSLTSNQASINGSPGSFEGQNTNSSASPLSSFDGGVTSIALDSAQMPWLQDVPTESHNGGHLDAAPASDGDGRCLSADRASDAETIVVPNSLQPSMPWLGTDFANAIPGHHHSNNTTTGYDEDDEIELLEEAFEPDIPLVQGCHVNIIDLTKSADNPTNLGKRGRDRDDVDGEKTTSSGNSGDNGGNGNSENSAARGSNKKTCGRLQQDMDFLLNTLGQDEQEMRAQLARHQRPAIFDQIYRAQLAQSLEMATGEKIPGPSMPPIPTASAANVYHNTASLLTYNFPTSLPSIHNADPNGVVADFFSMQNPAAMVDITDPESLDRFLGYTEGQGTRDSATDGPPFWPPN